MHAIKAIYDGSVFKPMQPIPVQEECEVIITFLEPSNRWQDPISLAALEECKQIEANPEKYKGFNDIDELFSNLMSNDDE